MKLTVHVHAQYQEWDKSYRFTAFGAKDMDDCGYIHVQAIEIDFEEPPHDVLVNGTVEAFRKERDRILGKAQAQATQLDRQINELLCIEHKPEPVDPLAWSKAAGVEEF